jgi:hypothetical protein
MLFLNETVGHDGSYSALVKLYGSEFAVHYVAGEVRVYATSQVNTRNWKTRKNPETVKKLVAMKLKTFTPEWHAAHAALYAPETV